jgi:hypothetical protein
MVSRLVPPPCEYATNARARSIETGESLTGRALARRGPARGRGIVKAVAPKGR